MYVHLLVDNVCIWCMCVYIVELISDRRADFPKNNLQDVDSKRQRLDRSRFPNCFNGVVYFLGHSGGQGFWLVIVTEVFLQLEQVAFCDVRLLRRIRVDNENNDTARHTCGG